MDRSLRVACAVLALAALTGCGSDSSPSRPAPQPMTTVVTQGGTNGLPPRFLQDFGSFTTTAAGQLEVLVDWTFASNNVDVYVARQACTPTEINNRTCSLLMSSESTTAKPERLSTPAVPAGTYFLYIGNRGPTDESLSYQVLLTR